VQKSFFKHFFSLSVPDEFQGRGIAKVIARKAFKELSKSENSKLILSCTYLQDFYRKNKKDFEGKNIAFA
jgi:predicted GNAT family acetyltransferase